MNNEGYIKIFRSILDWEWSDDPVLFSFFVKLIVIVNYKERDWHGITVDKGQIVTSIASLCSITKLSRNAVLRCLKTLVQSGEISEEVKPNKYRVITVTNYKKYQDAVDPLRDNSRDNYKDNYRDNSRDNYRGTTKERKNRKKVSSSPTGMKIRGRFEKKKNKLGKKKMKWTFGEVKEFAKTVKGGDDYNACDFRRGFVKSGTAFPDNWQDVFRSFAAAGLEAQDEFLKKLEGGAYISKWGEGVWS